MKPKCIICGKLIPVDRLARASARNTAPRYHDKGCQRIAHRIVDAVAITIKYPELFARFKAERESK
jgi:hypothetical protein